MTGGVRNNATAAITVQSKPRKAKCTANQEAVQRLEQEATKYAQSNYFYTIKRAVKSLAEHKEPVTTHKQAMELKFVGPALAKLIVLQSTAMAGSAMVGSAGSSSKSNKNQSGGSPTSIADTDGGQMKVDSKSSARAATTAPSTAAAAAAASSTTATTKSFSTKRSAAAASLLAGRQTRVAPPPPRKLQKLDDDAKEAKEPVNLGCTPKQSAYHSAREEAEMLVLPSQGPWKVLLVVDGREHKSQQVVSSCKQAGIPTEERHLPIGDMAWVAQCIVPKQKTIEIMVGTIIERKEVNDLASSLYGTRFSEQRLRLSQCGVPQVLFLVEGDLNGVTNCPADTLQMAMMETRIQLGFQVIQTQHLQETVRVLKGLHRRIVQRTFPEAFWSTQKYNENNDINSSSGIAAPLSQKDNRIPSFVRDPDAAGGKRRHNNRRASSLLEMVFDTAPVPPFDTERFITYAELKAKVELDREQATRRVGAVTLAMLKQIPTLSIKKCTAIAAKYPTINRLLEALCYETCDDNWEETHMNSKPPKPREATDPAKLIQTIPVGHNLTIGPKSAAEVYTALCTLGDGALLLPNLLAVALEKPAKSKTSEARTTTKSKKPAASNLKKPPPAAAVAAAAAFNERAAAATAAAAASNGGGRKRDGPMLASTPPRKHDAVPETIDLMTPNEKPAAKSKTVFISSNPMDDSFLLSSPDSSPVPPLGWKGTAARPTTAKDSSFAAKASSNPSASTKAEKRKGPKSFLLDGDSSTDDDDDGDFDLGNLAVNKTMNNNSGVAAEDAQYQKDLDLAIRASLGETPSPKHGNSSTSESSVARSTPRPDRKPAARKVSNDSSDRETASASTAASTSTQSSDSSPGDFSLSPHEMTAATKKEETNSSKNDEAQCEPMGSLRARLAQKLDREVIEID